MEANPPWIQDSLVDMPTPSQQSGKSKKVRQGDIEEHAQSILAVREDEKCMTRHDGDLLVLLSGKSRKV